MSTRADRQEAAKVLRAILATIEAGKLDSTRNDGPRLTAIAAAATALDIA